jgi:hypothetical protein
MVNRKALVIGLNYPGTKKEQKCGVKNARKVRDYLIRYCKSRPKDIVLMTDVNPSRKRG